MKKRTCKWKKRIALIMAMIMAAALAACASPAAQQSESDAPAEETTEDTASDTAEDTAAETESGEDQMTIFFTNAILTAPYCALAARSYAGLCSREQY